MYDRVIQEGSVVDLKQFRLNVTTLVHDEDRSTKHMGDEDFHKLVTGWLNEVTVAKAKAAADEIVTQVKGGIHKALDAIHRYHKDK